MKNVFKYLFFSLAIVGGSFLTSCSDEGNSGLREKPVDPVKKSHSLIVNPTNKGKVKERNLIITAEANSQVNVKVNFKGSKNMYRLYMTQNFIGGTDGVVPFKYNYDAAKLKADGSINLDGKDKKEFTYHLKFPAPGAKDKVVQYVLWATTGRGDFRDAKKRNAIADDAIGVITIKAGKVMPSVGTISAGVKSFSAVMLAAPLRDGSSKSFISLFNNKVYAINQGEEYAALWDFGYFYGRTRKSSFSSASNYPSNVIDIPSISKVKKENLNSFYIQKAKKITNFDDVTKAADLDVIAKPSTQRVTNLVKGDVLEFVDTYNNKGIIKITEIVPGAGVKGKIKFDVKVQVKSVPVKG